MKVAIVGSGPSAAYANAAVRELDLVADIYGRQPLPNERFGAFWLRFMPTGFTAVKPVPIRISYVGTKEQYLRKQWGGYDETWSSSFQGETSPDAVTYKEEYYYPEKDVWSWLCDGGQWSGPNSVPKDLNELRGLLKDYDVIYCALKNLPEWHFGSVWYEGHVRREGNAILVRDLCTPDLLLELPAQCVYNGLSSAVARCTLLDGQISLEIPSYQDESRWRRLVEPFRWAATVDDIPPWVKPPTYQVDPNIVPIGRWATLDRSALSESAYHAVKLDLSRRIKEHGVR